MNRITRLLLMVALSAPAAFAASRFEKRRLEKPTQYGMKPYGFLRQPNCGCDDALWFYQLEVHDLERQRRLLDKTFNTADAQPLPSGCECSASWSADVGNRDYIYGQTRWIPEAKMPAFEQEVLSLGGLTVSDDVVFSGESQVRRSTTSAKVGYELIYVQLVMPERHAHLKTPAPTVHFETPVTVEREVSLDGSPEINRAMEWFHE